MDTKSIAAPPAKRLTWDTGRGPEHDTMVSDEAETYWTVRGSLTLTEALRAFARGYDHAESELPTSARAHCLRTGAVEWLTFSAES